MKVLKIDINGLPLYKKGFSINLYAQQRVQSEHCNCVHNLFNNIYSNNIESFIGINASGKTTALKLISFVFSLINGNSLTSDPRSNIIPLNCEIQIKTYMQINNIIYSLSTILKKTININNEQNNEHIIILDEELKGKEISSSINRTNLFDESNMKTIKKRGPEDEYLSDDVSLMVSFAKKQIIIPFVDLTVFTNLNIYFGSNDSVSSDILSLLDPTIEYVSIERKNDGEIARLKFYDQKEIELNNCLSLEFYLSSGTIKGLRVFSAAIKMLKYGGYLILDEIENHFNQELVSSLVKLFTNCKTNPYGATLIFSTHYAELLDIIDRNDSIYITKSDNGLTIENLNDLLNRNDLKKSEIYQSNYLHGTAPKYSHLMELQNNIIKGYQTKNEG